MSPLTLPYTAYRYFVLSSIRFTSTTQCLDTTVQIGRDTSNLHDESGYSGNTCWVISSIKKGGLGRVKLISGDGSSQRVRHRRVPGSS